MATFPERYLVPVVIISILPHRRHHLLPYRYINGDAVGIATVERIAEFAQAREGQSSVGSEGSKASIGGILPALRSPQQQEGLEEEQRGMSVEAILWRRRKSASIVRSHSRGFAAMGRGKCDVSRIEINRCTFRQFSRSELLMQAIIIWRISYRFSRESLMISSEKTERSFRYCYRHCGQS